MRGVTHFLLLGNLVIGSAAILRADTTAVVVVPVADLRSDQSLPPLGKSDDKQQTQLLFGETVKVKESSGAWSLVEAVEQPSFKYHQRWEGYPGWVLRKSLVEVSRNPKTPAVMLVLRNDVLKVAESFLGTPYYWGGLSMQGIDCSGLVHIAYRLNGLVVPRDSLEQHMQAKAITRAELKAADLIFSAPVKTPQKVTHVAFYAGSNEIIEAPQTGMVVRRISFKEKYGRDLSEVDSGQTVGERVIYFGRFMP
jgi:cell wall-associated NlpC family hydrolase